MGAFLLIIARKRNDPAAAGLSRTLAREAQRHGYAVSHLNPGAWLGVRGPHPPLRREVGGWTLIGDVFDRRTPVLPEPSPHDPHAYERKLLSRIWGRYVGVRFGAGDRLEALLRDPSGALECVVWNSPDVTLVCSTAEDWLLQRLQPAWRIDFERVGHALRDPLAETGALLIDGPTALQPGALQPYPLDRPPTVLWRPSDFARLSLDDPPPAQVAQVRLRDAVDEATSGLAGLPGTLAAEVSGGLDSSIIASSLVHAGRDVALWLNAYGETAESDERLYVQALARQLGISPVVAPKTTRPIDRTWLDALSCDFRPGLNALDQAHDLDWVERLTARGVTALMTGKGGDSALLNRATSDVFVDEWRRDPWTAFWSKDMAELATSNEVSMWTLVLRARTYARTGTALLRRDHPILAPARAAAPLHPWIEDWGRFGPAKATHIAGLVDNVARHGPSTLTKAIDVRNPLCAQPVIETCLALPASLLTLGGRERGLARRAFSDRLPREILDRRSKGDMTRIYGRLILDSLDALRPWLIEGRLAANGIIDPADADRYLTRETLTWRGKYSTVMVAAAFESWVRTWERRLSPGC